jgi:spermidine synthase
MQLSCPCDLSAESRPALTSEKSFRILENSGSTFTQGLRPIRWAPVAIELRSLLVLNNPTAVRRPFILALFLVSGACGLIFELVWIRMAGTVIGNTTYAVGTVIGVYMGGLALGAKLGGREADRRRGGTLVRLYGLLEGGVGLSALAVPLLLFGSRPLFQVLWSAVGPVTPIYAGLRILLVAVALIVPTTLMGATLPVLTRLLASEATIAREAGWAYAINTLGGVAGTLVGGFVLIPSLGLRATLALAAGLNLAISLAALAFARRLEGEVAHVPPAGPRPHRPALALSAFSGFTALAYEAAWSRSLVLSLGSTIQAITLILSAFIFGLALGSALGSRLEVRVKDAGLAVAVLQAVIGIVAILLLPILGDLPVRVAELIDSAGPTYESLLLHESLLIALVILAPATLLGAVFPFACRLAAGSERTVGRTVGAVYTWNTLGSIGGTILASFVLIPWIGLSSTIRLAATVNFGLAAVLLGTSPGSRWSMAIPPLVIAGLAWIIPTWNTSVVASGAYLYGGTYVKGARAANVGLSEFVRDYSPPVAEYWDAYGLASVHRQGSILTLRVNGKVDASTGPLDALTQLYAGHLPLLHHPAPRRVLIIGLGSGCTVGAVARHPVEQIDCVEISSAVVRAAKHFADATGHPLEDPRVRLIVGDGRNLVQFSRDLYDVIISEPSNLWVSGMANLFTRDFFEEVRRRLTPRGIFCQWVYSAGLDPKDLRLVLRTFYGVFPEGSLWEVQPGGDYLLLGGEHLEAPRYPEFETRASAPGVKEDLADPGLSAAMSVAGHLLGDATDARVIAGPGAFVTDDRPTLEYTAPRSLHQETRVGTLRLLEANRLERVERGHFLELSDEQALLLARRREDRRLLARAIECYWRGDHRETLRLLDEAGKEIGRDRQTLAFRDDVLVSLVVQGAQSLADGDVDGAMRTLKQVPRSAPHRGQAYFETAKACRLAARRGDARECYEEALADPASAFDSLLGLAEMAEEEGRLGEATSRWRDAVRVRPDLAPVRLRLAASLIQAGRLGEARECCMDALRIDPADTNARRILQAMGRE